MSFSMFVLLQMWVGRGYVPTWARADIESSYFSRKPLVGNQGKVYEFKKARFKLEPIINSARTAKSKEDLIERLKFLTELDDIHCGRTGRFYNEVVRLNEQDHPQPRRTTYSVTIDKPRWSELNTSVRSKICTTVTDMREDHHKTGDPARFRSSYTTLESFYRDVSMVS